MPILAVYTTVKSIPDSFLGDITKLISELLGKPEGTITARVHTDQKMAHGGTTEPCACVELYSIGKLGVEENKGHTKAIGDFISEYLGIPQTRFYVIFNDLVRSDVGYNGTTYKE